MSTAAAIAMLAPPTSDAPRGGNEARGEGSSFDRHLDVAEASPPAGGERASARPPATPGSGRGSEADAATVAEATVAADASVGEETDPAVAAELVAQTAAGVVIIVPPPIADPLAQAAPPLATSAPLTAAATAGTAAANAAAATAAATAAADIAADLASAHAAGATAAAANLARARAAPAQDQSGNDPLATALLAGAVAPKAAPTAAVIAALPAMPSTGTPTDEAPDTAAAAAVDPTSAAAAAAAGTSAPPIATGRPRDSRFEREAAPDVLAEGVIPMATIATDAGGTPRPGDAVAALGAVGLERMHGKIEAPAAPQVPPGESARAANAMDRAVAGQVSRAILTRGADGERMLVLRLTPPELGTVRIEVIERAGVMTARIHAEDDAVRGALERSLPQLRQDLRANDAPVRDVSLADAWNGFANRQGRNDGSGGRERRQRDDDAPAFALDGIAPQRSTPRRAPDLGGFADARGVDARA